MLVDLAERHGRRAPDGTLIEDVTHEMLAGSTGAAREVVSRTLKRLESEGLLRTGRARLLIRDLERLRGEASSQEV
ncbi:MAG: winged helix-turn-helix domain-containing protein [Deltaproteobacteria bacterium]|nr:winged helix-turn-helix domain-containing protein [Deltaproteobacteria bacterium]